MALLPKIPWTDIDDFRVAVDAPVSTDLWTDTVVDLNYLKATLTDGALAPQTITTGIVVIAGAGTAFQLDNDGNVDGNFTVNGTLSTGVFFSSEQLLWLLDV
jgi:hypothetical protein